MLVKSKQITKIIESMIFVLDTNDTKPEMNCCDKQKCSAYKNHRICDFCDNSNYTNLSRKTSTKQFEQKITTQSIKLWVEMITKIVDSQFFVFYKKVPKPQKRAHLGYKYGTVLNKMTKIIDSKIFVIFDLYLKLTIWGLCEKPVTRSKLMPSNPSILSQSSHNL